ncbi:MAG: ABC transporter permease [Polyangiaceae bacterium]|nr:ABC transporter permease [Polyangiaceae bacterium]
MSEETPLPAVAAVPDPGPEHPAPERPSVHGEHHEIEKGTSLWRDAWKRLKKNRVAVASAIILIVLVLVCIIHPEVTKYPYDQANLKLGATSPSWRDHWFGTDDYGRDLFSRVTFGGRVSLAVGVIATFISFTIGVSYGAIAGYFGGRIDGIMMRIVDVLYTLPLLVFEILLTAFFANKDTIFYEWFIAVLGIFKDDPTDPAFLPLFKIVFVFGALGTMSWLTMARIVRGQVISLRGQLFVEAAQSVGVSDMRLIFRHLIPNALGPIIVYTTLTIPEVMLTEAFLSFLGLGTEEPLSSWGQLVSNGVESLDLNPWLTIFPGVMLAVTLFCFNFLGDGLRDALDPRIRKD